MIKKRKIFFFLVRNLINTVITKCCYIDVHPTIKIFFGKLKTWVWRSNFKVTRRTLVCVTCFVTLNLSAIVTFNSMHLMPILLFFRFVERGSIREHQQWTDLSLSLNCCFELIAPTKCVRNSDWTLLKLKVKLNYRLYYIKGYIMSSNKKV